MLRAIATLLLIATSAHAFNARDHKLIADIAWQQLDEPTRMEIVKVLRRHSRFDDDFAKQGDIADDRWVFQQAAVWPDIASPFRAGWEGRRLEYHSGDLGQLPIHRNGICLHYPLLSALLMRLLALTATHF